MWLSKSSGQGRSHFCSLLARRRPAGGQTGLGLSLLSAICCEASVGSFNPTRSVEQGGSPSLGPCGAIVGLTGSRSGLIVITHVLCALIRRGSRNPQLKHELYDNRGLHLLPSALSPDAKWPGPVPRREAVGKRVSGGCGLCFQQQNWAHFCSERSDTFGVRRAPRDLPLVPCQCGASLGRALSSRPERSRMGEKACLLPLGEMEVEPGGTQPGLEGPQGLLSPCVVCCIPELPGPETSCG